MVDGCMGYKLIYCKMIQYIKHFDNIKYLTDISLKMKQSGPGAQ
jgi:hypothetical protein